MYVIKGPMGLKGERGGVGPPGAWGAPGPKGDMGEIGLHGPEVILKTCWSGVFYALNTIWKLLINSYH